MKFEKESLNEVQLEFLELKTKQFLSFDLELSEEKRLELLSKMFLVIIVDNYGSRNIDLVRD